MFRAGRFLVALGFFAAGTGLTFLGLGLASGAPAGTLHKPDLKTLRSRLATTVRIENNTETGGQKLLRFSNTVWNGGDGPLELRPENDPATDVTYAYQTRYSHDDAGNWYVHSEILAGTFIFHEEHNHWHFDDFALYEIHRVLSDGSVGSDILARSQKQTFCIAENTIVDSTLEHDATSVRTYPGGNCDQNTVEGIGVGWGDTYRWSLAGQSIDITGLPNGSYWLISQADPNNRISETNNHNNNAKIKIKIVGDTVEVLK
jgi:Lysyl oxidase